MLTDKKCQSVNAGDGTVSTSGAENERVENTLKVLGVRATASVDVSALILGGIGNSRPPGKPEEGGDGDDRRGEQDDDASPTHKKEGPPEGNPA